MRRKIEASYSVTFLPIPLPPTTHVQPSAGGIGNVFVLQHSAESGTTILSTVDHDEESFIARASHLTAS